MLYYVRSGDVDISLNAKSHRQAAVDAFSSSNEDDFGLYVIVSEQHSVDENAVCFSTEFIMNQFRSLSMRVVN